MLRHKRLISLLLALVMLAVLIPAAALTGMAGSAYTVSGTVNLAWSEGSNTTVQLLQNGTVVGTHNSTEQTFSYNFAVAAPGTYELQIDATFCEDFTQTVTVSDGSVVVNADLARKTEDVSLVVVCEDGQTDDPAAPLTVQLIKDGEVRHTSVGYCGNGTDEITVEFQDVPLGIYDIKMSKEGYADDSLTGYWFAGGYAGTVWLWRPFGQVRGSVIAKGVNVEPILLELLKDGVVQTTTTTTVGEQAYKFAERLPYGDYTLRVTVAGYQTYTQDVTIDAKNESVRQINMNPIYGRLFVNITGTDHEVCVELLRHGHLFKYQDTATGIASFQSLLAMDYVIRIQDLVTNHYVYTDNITVPAADMAGLNVDLSCKHENVTTVTVEATCTADGSVTVTCDDCGEVITNETIFSAGGHDFKDGNCTICKQELAEAIDLNDDNKVSALDAQLLAEAEAELRTLSDEQWAELGDICVQDIIDYILGRHPGA